MLNLGKLEYESFQGKATQTDLARRGEHQSLGNLHHIRFLQLMERVQQNNPTENKIEFLI